MRVAKTWWVRIVYFVLLLFVEWNHAPGDQRNSGDCPELDLRGEQWRWPNSLLGSVKCSTGSTASKENGEECGEMHGMLPRVSGITNAREHSAWVRRSVHGNGGCFNLRVVVFVCLRPMSPDVLRGWVPKTVSSPEWAESVAVSRPWEWPERGICEAWSTTLVERYQRSCVRPVNSELWPCEPVPWRCRRCVYMGDGKGWIKRWVPCELRESSASSHDSRMFLWELNHVTDMHRKPAGIVRVIHHMEPRAKFITNLDIKSKVTFPKWSHEAT